MYVRTVSSVGGHTARPDGPEAPYESSKYMNNVNSVILRRRLARYPFGTNRMRRAVEHIVAGKKYPVESVWLALVWAAMIVTGIFGKHLLEQSSLKIMAIAALVTVAISFTMASWIHYRKAKNLLACIYADILRKERAYQVVFSDSSSFGAHTRLLSGMTGDNAYQCALDYARREIIKWVMVIERSPHEATRELARERLKSMFDAAILRFGEDLNGNSTEGYKPFFKTEGKREIVKHMKDYTAGLEAP